MSTADGNPEEAMNDAKDRLEEIRKALQAILNGPAVGHGISGMQDAKERHLEWLAWCVEEIDQLRRLWPAEDATRPGLMLLAKLGSLVVHIEEFLSLSGHEFKWRLNKTVIEQLLEDPEVREWMAEMDRMALLPKKRGA